jgi:hypothetical protein
LYVPADVGRQGSIEVFEELQPGGSPVYAYVSGRAPLLTTAVKFVRPMIETVCGLAANDVTAGPLREMMETVPWPKLLT